MTSDPGIPPVIDVEVLTSSEPQSLTSEELGELRHARALLTTPGVAMRFANLIGSPIEKGVRLLPVGASKVIHTASRAALNRALHIALNSLPSGPRHIPDNRFHKLLAGTSGAVGGAFGLAALFIELPISTTLILRSIAQIAGSQGHDLRSIETRLACLEVFALGGETTTDDAAETSYWAIRAGLARLVTEAAGTLTGRGVLAESAPTAIRLVTALAARFGVVVSEQAAAKAVPVLGAATGAAINVVFMDHFQKMAEGHFIVRRLERTHGTQAVQRAYESLAWSGRT